jgi:hypothetical protein
LRLRLTKNITAIIIIITAARRAAMDAVAPATVGEELEACPVIGIG